MRNKYLHINKVPFSKYAILMREYVSILYLFQISYLEIYKKLFEVNHSNSKKGVPQSYRFGTPSISLHL